MLEKEGFTTGAVIGVKKGHYSKILLENWPSCTSFYLIDVWQHLNNYEDLANQNDVVQNRIYNEALNSTSKWKNKIKVLRMYSSEAAKQIPNGSLDFAYIDARHDYCGVLEDIVSYWPKIRSGGILAGHDYVSHEEVGGRNDWTVCSDGRHEPGSVKRAILEFSASVGVQVVVTYRERHYNSWLMRKP